MIWTRTFATACCTLLLFTGCTERETDVNASDLPQRPTQDLPALPTQAQPRLATMKLYVGAEELTAEIASRPQEIITGMMFRTNVVDGDSMLFVSPQPHQAAFWMMNCPTPLSCAYIDPEGIIQEIHAMEPFNTNSIQADSHNILFVLETAEGWFDRHNVRTGMLVRTESGSLIETFFQPRTR